MYKYINVLASKELQMGVDMCVVSSGQGKGALQIY